MKGKTMTSRGIAQGFGEKTREASTAVGRRKEGPADTAFTEWQEKEGGKNVIRSMHSLLQKSP